MHNPKSSISVYMLMDIQIQVVKQKDDMEIERFANLLTGLIEKYANKIDLDSLPDQPRPEAYKI